MSEHGRFTFEPIFNLVNGRPVGMEVQRSQARDHTQTVARHAVWGPRQLAEFDSGIAIASVLHATGYDATVPLHVDVLADTVVGARRRVSQIRQSLLHRDDRQPVPPILLEINPALSAAPPTELLENLSELRANGFGICFDDATRGFGIDLIGELEPDLVKIGAQLVARLPFDPRARTVTHALCEVCRAVGVRVAAVGVTSTEELAAVRDHGIPWAQGPLLAPPRRRPATTGILMPVNLMPALQADLRPVPRPRNPAPGPALADLSRAPVSLPVDVTAESVRQAFSGHPQAGCVVLLDITSRPVGFLDRNRFMLAISGPFGRALYANRPARGLAETPRTMHVGTGVRAALQECLSGDRARSYDDVVLVDDVGCCVGIARVSDLLQEATGAPSAA
jgi:EAL domain-containing protein (putative c-di-GMP-specific phosphodiesterase class I)